MNKYPYPGQPKEENFEYGKKAVYKFLDNNDIKRPKFKIDLKTRYYGYCRYRSNTVAINPKNCRTPVKTPGYAWSYTGYKADLTIAGVLAHEVGHYVDKCLKFPSSRLVKFVRGEKKVSSYEPDSQEVMAEAMKLFILNPDLLRVGRPKRYEFLTENCGLIPIIDDDWKTVLSAAHPKLLAAAANWVKRK